MIFTEKEAALKRCTPFAVVRLLPREVFLGGVASGELELNCIGSRCAQWRQYDAPDIDGNSFFTKGAPYIGRGLSSGAGIYTQRAPARGYCGLAGRVE
ncbi:MAG: hypothetical protein ACREDH_12165 [Methylocella sp.]